MVEKLLEKNLSSYHDPKLTLNRYPLDVVPVPPISKFHSFSLYDRLFSRLVSLYWYNG